MVNNKKFLCIVDYHSKLPMLKATEGFSVDHLMRSCKIIFSEYGFSKKIIFDASRNSVSEKFQNF